MLDAVPEVLGVDDALGDSLPDGVPLLLDVAVCDGLGDAVLLRVLALLGVEVCDVVRVREPVPEAEGVRLLDCEGVCVCVCERLSVCDREPVTDGDCDWLGVITWVIDVDWLRVPVRDGVIVPLAVSEVVALGVPEPEGDRVTLRDCVSDAVHELVGVMDELGDDVAESLNVGACVRVPVADDDEVSVDDGVPEGDGDGVELRV